MKKLLLVLLFVPMISFGQTEDEYIERGIAAFEAGDYYGAINQYNKALEFKNRWAYIWNLIGNAKFSLKDYEGAIENYTKAIDSSIYWSDMPDYYYNRGVCKMNLGDTVSLISAQVDFTLAIKQNPDYTDAYRMRGVLRQTFQNLDMACDDWKKAASLGDSEAAQWVREDCN